MARRSQEAVLVEVQACGGGGIDAAARDLPDDPKNGVGGPRGDDRLAGSHSYGCICRIAPRGRGPSSPGKEAEPVHRTRTDSLWADRCSAAAMASTTGSSLCKPARSSDCPCMVRPNESTPRALKERLAPPVGSTWLAPVAE